MTNVSDAGARSAPAAALVSAVLLVATGLLFAVVHAGGSDPGDPEGWVQHLSLGLPMIAAGVLALIGLTTGQPWLVLAGGLSALPMGVVSIVGLPAVVCGVIVITAGARSRFRPTGREVTAAVAVVVLLVGSFVYEVLHQDPREWATGDGSAGSSNVITATESLVVFLAVGLALALAFATSRTAHHPRVPQTTL